MTQAGYGLIETMRVREGRIPLLARHLERLERSLRLLGQPAPARDVAALVTPFSGMGEALLRVEVCYGRASVTVRELPALEPPRVITAPQPHTPYPHKTTERACFSAAAAEAARVGANDALLLTRDAWVAEGTVWNVFWWDGERLQTPALALGILPGIGRARVLELVERVEVGRYERAALDGRSLFLTNAVRGVVPMATLDGASVPADPRTAGLAQRFWPEA
jgi:branched-subunit amino acid aminotransferase/4-amino-4-deoxychorismate lyase